MNRYAKHLSVRSLILLLAPATLLLLSANRVSAEQPVSTTEYVVVTGDTLWEIADAVTSPEESIRSMVWEIRRLNRLESADLQPGQRLLIPTG